jgi:hypothetical protein
MARGREHKIMHFEVANEAWQNGFAGETGVAEIRALARRLAGSTTIPVAVSDSEGHECADHLALYRGLNVEILTEHFPRDTSGRLRDWGPVVAPWSVGECEGLPPLRSNNEPIGPGSSVEAETHPTRLVAAAVSSYMAGVGLYVFHTDAGVSGRTRLADTPNARETLAALAAMKRYLPPGVANWQRHRHDSNRNPFVPHAGGQRGAVWPDGHNDGAVEVFASVKDDRFFVVPVGVINALTLEARYDMSFEVLHPLTGEEIARHTLRAGQTVRLRPLPVLIVSGHRIRNP